MRPHLPFLIVTAAACSGPARTAPPPADPPAPSTMSLADSGIVPAWLDRAADPCQDFFQHACGGFVATAEIPADRASWSAIQTVVQSQETFLRDTLEAAAANPGDDPLLRQLGDYYAACTDEDAIERAGLTPIADLLRTADSVRDFPTAVAAVTALHASGIFALWDVGPTQDFADATQVIAGIDQSGLGLPEPAYYLEDDGNLPTVRAAYRAHVMRLLTLAGRKPAAATAAADAVLAFETALAKVQQSEVTRRDPRAIYHRVERAGLAKAAPSIDWDRYFQALGIGHVTQVTVNDPAYVAAVAALLKQTPAATLRDYLTAQVLDATAPLLSRALVEEDFTMTQALSGQQALAPRWRRCVNRTDDDLGEALAQPYVRARFSPAARREASDLVVAVKAAMKAELATLPWMDAASRAAAAGKLETMDALVGYPDTWRAYTFAVRRDDFAGNVRAARAFEQARRLATIGKPVDRHDWGMTPPTVNAYYDGSLNQIALPAGQLQPPFFGATFHPAVNFGSTGGGTIGHEMTHGFDDEGSQFDARGNLREWWSPATTAAFAEATQCVIDQYAGYEAVPGVHLDGALTAGENIADIGGVKLAFQAYHAWRARQAAAPPAQVEGYSDDQLYFLAYAQSWCSKDTPERLETMAHSNPHSPPRWRVNGVIADQPGFATAFACRPGAPMAPANACTVW